MDNQDKYASFGECFQVHLHKVLKSIIDKCFHRQIADYNEDKKELYRSIMGEERLEQKVFDIALINFTFNNQKLVNMLIRRGELIRANEMIKLR